MGQFDVLKFFIDRKKNDWITATDFSIASGIERKKANEYLRKLVRFGFLLVKDLKPVPGSHRSPCYAYKLKKVSHD